MLKKFKIKFHEFYSNINLNKIEIFKKFHLGNIQEQISEG